MSENKPRRGTKLYFDLALDIQYTHTRRKLPCWCAIKLNVPTQIKSSLKFAFSLFSGCRQGASKSQYLEGPKGHLFPWRGRAINDTRTLLSTVQFLRLPLITLFTKVKKLRSLGLLLMASPLSTYLFSCCWLGWNPISRWCWSLLSVQKQRIMLCNVLFHNQPLFSILRSGELCQTTNSCHPTFWENK